jgi:hypothetical protein
MQDEWLLSGLIPILGGLVCLGLARRPPDFAVTADGRPRRSARPIQITVAAIGALAVLSGLVVLLRHAI